MSMDTNLWMKVVVMHVAMLKEGCIYVDLMII